MIPQPSTIDDDAEFPENVHLPVFAKMHCVVVDRCRKTLRRPHVPRCGDSESSDSPTKQQGCSGSDEVDFTLSGLVTAIAV